MRVTEAVHQLLGGDRIAVDREGQILFALADERAVNLVLVALALGVNRHGVGGGRQRDRRQGEGRLLGAQAVSGGGGGKLGGDSDVTGDDGRRGDDLLAYRLSKLREPFFLTAAHVERMHISAQRAAEHFDEADLAEGVGSGLEDVGAERSVGIARDLHLLLLGIPGNPLDRRLAFVLELDFRIQDGA